MHRPKLTALAKRKLAVARSTIEAGMGVVAIQPRSKVPDVRFCAKGADSAVDDAVSVRAWLAEDPSINLAALAKGSPVLVLDVDGAEGEKALKRFGPLPKTRETITRNGRHLYFRHDGRIAGSKIKFEPELDIIASGYVLMPESAHPEGGRYRSDDAAAPIAKLPGRIANAILARAKSPKSGAKAGATKDDRINEGGRDNALTSVAGALRRQGYGADLITTALTAIDEAHCEPPLGMKAVRKIARSVERYEPADAELFGEMSEVEPRNVEFSWFPYLVRGAVNLLEGDPGTGKTYLLCTVAACFSAGIPLPGQSEARPVSVLFMSAEDDPDTTLVRRLQRMGADLSRITYTTRYFRLEEEALGWIDKHVEEKGIELVILDPLLAYMQGGIDMNKANETRPFMARLAELAKRRNITIIGLRHLTKAASDKAIYRGLGSIDITAAARSAIMLGVHPEDEDMRVMMHIKHNLSPRGPSLAYELVGGNFTAGTVPKLKWLGEVDIRPEDLAFRKGEPGRPDDALQQAITFLQQTLADGPKPIKQVLTEGDRRSHKDRTLRRAAEKIGLEKVGKTWKIAKTTL